MHVIILTEVMSNFNDQDQPVDLLCAICIEVRDVRSQDNRVLECMHVFHEECIDKWFEGTRQKRIPICRHEASVISRTFGGESNVASRRSMTTFQATNAVFRGPPNSADPRNVTFQD